MSNLTASHKSEVIKNWVQTLAIVLGGIWAVFAFVFEVPIKLTWEDPHLEVSSNIEVVTPRIDTIAGFVVKGTIRIENQSNFSIWIIGSIIEIRAHMIVEPPSRPTADTMNDTMRDSNRGLETFHLYRTISENIYDSETVAVGILRKDLKISPKEVFESEFLTFVPATHDTVSLDVRVSYARKQRLHSRISEPADAKWQLEYVLRDSEDSEEVLDSENNVEHQNLVREIEFRQTQSHTVAYLRPEDSAPSCL